MSNVGLLIDFITNGDKFYQKNSPLSYTKQELIKKFISKKDIVVTVDGCLVKLSKDKKDFSKLIKVYLPTDQKSELIKLLKLHNTLTTQEGWINESDMLLVKEIAKDTAKSITVHTRHPEIISFELTEKQFDFWAYQFGAISGEGIIGTTHNWEFAVIATDFWFLYLKTQYLKFKHKKMLKEIFTDFESDVDSGGVMDSDHQTKSNFYTIMNLFDIHFDKEIINYKKEA